MPPRTSQPRPRRCRATWYPPSSQLANRGSVGTDSQTSCLPSIGAQHLGEIEYETSVEISDDPADAIVTSVADHGIEGLAMGTRADRGRLSSAVFGSISETVIRRTNVPVLVVKRGGAGSESALRQVISSFPDVELFAASAAVRYPSERARVHPRGREFWTDTSNGEALADPGGGRSDRGR